MASEMMGILVSMIESMQGDDSYESNDFEAMRAAVDEMSQSQPVSDGVHIDGGTLGGVETELLRSEGCQDGIALIYIHGGAFITGSAGDSRGYASNLAAQTCFPVWTLSYRCCPEHPFPAAPDDCFSVYRAIVDSHPDWNIVLVGESAGATLCLDVAILARREHVRMPDLLCLFSPLTELAEELSSRRFNAENDHCVRADINTDMKRLYCPEADSTDELLSPLRTDFAGFPPMQITVDSGEILLDDALCLARRAKEAGVDVHLSVFDGCFHAFPTTGTVTEEGSRILGETSALIDSIR